MEDDPAEEEARSPLWMVTREPLVNALVNQLADANERFRRDGRLDLSFSRAHLADVRGVFAASIRRGEERLHRLCALLGHSFFDGAYDLQSVVIGEVARERFSLVQPLDAETLYQQIDLELGNRLLDRVRLRGPESFERPLLVANFVEYQPHETNALAIHKMISRIKAEEEIWNKVADEIFGLDRIVARDKQLRELSHYVKDVFGIKIVVGAPDDVAAVQRTLETLKWTPWALEAYGVPAGDDAAGLRVVEVKDYLGAAKQSGWTAVKSVVSWCGRTFEIQVQPLGTYFREREVLTRESHAAFKARREAVRAQVADRDPLYGFTRDLLQWLFDPAETPAPRLPGVRVTLEG